LGVIERVVDVLASETQPFMRKTLFFSHKSVFELFSQKP
jgi:hypothetical protein